MTLVVSGHHGHRGADYHGIVLNKALGHPEKAVRHIQAELSKPDVVAHGGFRLVHHVHNLETSAFQLGFGPFLGFLLDSLGRINKLNDSRHLQRKDGNDNQQESGAGALLDAFCDLDSIPFHRPWQKLD